MEQAHGAEGRPNILLVVADGLAAHFSLETIESAGAIAESFFCSAIPTMASWSSILTGIHPVNLGWASGRNGAELPPGVSLLPELFLTSGYTTCACDDLRRKRHWFGNGFEFYIDAGVRLRTAPEPPDLNSRALRWLKSHHRETFLLCVHYPPLQDSSAVLELITGLDGLGLGAKTLVAITASAGSQSKGLSDAAIRVPLLVRWPGYIQPATRVAANLQMQDLAPTLLEAANLNIPSNMDGRSFLKLLTGAGDDPGRECIFTLEAGEPTGWSLRQGGYKLVRRSGTELFEVAAGAESTVNRPDIVQSMEAELDAWLAKRLEDWACVEEYMF